MGAQDFCRVESPGPNTPYEVGIRHIRIGEKQLEATVMYPMDEADVKGKSYTAKWYEDSVRMMKSYKRTLCNMQTITLPFVPEFLLRAFTNIMLPAYLNGDLCEKFASGKEAIRPMVFSHGLSADKNFYMAIYLAMASHGYVVVAINH